MIYYNLFITFLYSGVMKRQSMLRLMPVLIWNRTANIYIYRTLHADCTVGLCCIYWNLFLLNFVILVDNSENEVVDSVAIHTARGESNDFLN